MSLTGSVFSDLEKWANHTMLGEVARRRLGPTTRHASSWWWLHDHHLLLPGLPCQPRDCFERLLQTTHDRHHPVCRLHQETRSLCSRDWSNVPESNWPPWVSPSQLLKTPRCASTHHVRSKTASMNADQLRRGGFRFPHLVLCDCLRISPCLTLCILWRSSANCAEIHGLSTAYLCCTQ